MTAVLDGFVVIPLSRKRALKNHYPEKGISLTQKAALLIAAGGGDGKWVGLNQIKYYESITDSTPMLQLATGPAHGEFQ